MFKKMSLRRRMFSSFFFMGLLVFVVALLGWSENSRLHQHIETLTHHTLPSNLAVWKLYQGLTELDASEKTLLDPQLALAVRESENSRINNTIEKIEQTFQDYEKFAKKNLQQKQYQDLKIAWQKWKQNAQQFVQINQSLIRLGILNPLAEQLELVLQGQQDSPRFARAREGEVLLNQLRDRVRTNREFLAAANQVVQETLKRDAVVADQVEKVADQDLSQSRFWVLLGMILGPITAIALGFYFSNTITKPLGAKIAAVVNVAEQISAGNLTTDIPATTNDSNEIGKLLTAFSNMNQSLNSLIRQVQQSVIQITASSTQIAASGKQLEATVTEQLASTNQVVATAQEISGTSQQLLHTMNDVVNVSQDTAIAANNGQTDLVRMETTMRQLVDATGVISAKLAAINEKANNINSIVITITKVADQTNLLSLNAAIEAEKAGEYGLGFAVVAREIRRLADQTAVATLDIESMVTQMQSAVAAGVMEMDKFTKEVQRGVEDISVISLQLGQIIDQVQALIPRFEVVNHGMEAQSQGAMQISEAMVQLSLASGQTAESLRETNTALEQLNEAAQGLRREVVRFKLSP